VVVDLEAYRIHDCNMYTVPRNAQTPMYWARRGKRKWATVTEIPVFKE
jgi:hypothetical protein